MRLKKGQTSSVFVVFLLVIFSLLVLNISRIPPQYFFFLFAGIVIFALSFVNTNVALGILIFSMLLSPEMKLSQVADRPVVVRFDDIFLFIIFLAWLAKLAVFKDLRLVKRTSLNAPIFIYCLVCLISTAVRLIEGRGQLLQSSFYFLKYLEYFLVYFLVLSNIQDMRQAKIFVFLMIATCVLVSLYGLYTYFSKGIRATAPFEGGEGEPNTLAGYLILLISVMLGLLVYSDSSKLKIALFAILPFSVSAFLFTLSRGGWVGFFFMYMSFVIMARKAKGILLFSLIVAMVLMPLLAPPKVKERFTTTFVGDTTYTVMGKDVTLAESGVARIQAWKTGYRKLLEKPLFGHGIPGGSVIDNQFTRTMTELGLAGLFAFLFLMWRIFKAALRSIEGCRKDPFAQGIATGFLAGFIGLLVQGLSAADFIIIRIMEPFWFLMGLIVLLPGFCVAANEKTAVDQWT